MDWPFTTPDEHLAAAARYERWAKRNEGNPKIMESFRRLAAEARARAKGG